MIKTLTERYGPFFAKYREFIVYIIFGGLTTLVNYVTYTVCVDLFGISISLSTILAWVVSVTFAYITNRIWVFESRARGIKAVMRELASFVAARLLSGVLELGIMNVFAERMGYNDKIMKILSNIFVVIFNYVASKLFIFKKT